MAQYRFSPLEATEIQTLISVSRGTKPATVWIKGGTILNVCTGELEKVEIAIARDRIAYVGKRPPLTDEQTLIIEASDYTIVPGYIEPHAHPFQLYNPISFADYCVSHGTTTLIADNISFFNRLHVDEWIGIMDQLSSHPVKMLWWARLEPQTTQEELLKKYELEPIQKLLNHPLVIQGGEVSHWVPLLNGDRKMAQKIAAAKRAGKRIEVHAPGASEDTLNALAAAGMTSDHEAIQAEEVLRRLRLGYYAPLRHSSIRPDLPVLLQGLKERLTIGWERLMLTTDGSTPPFLADGFTDELIRIAIQEGIDPVLVYRMATLNVATYYGLDEHIGMIAPGRYADLLFLTSLDQPTPQMVMIDGKMIYNRQERRHYSANIKIDWEKYGLLEGQKPSLTIQPEHLRIRWEEGRRFPIIHMVNDVITVLTEQTLPIKDGYVDLQQEGLLYIALVSREGNWITKGVLSGFAAQLPALASTYTMSGDYLVIGCDLSAMTKALHYITLHSGIALIDDHLELTHLPLPIGGGISDLEMPELIEKSTRFRQKIIACGYPYGDPFYSLLFLTSTHLPKLRITERGIVSVKDQSLLLPSTSIK